MQAIMEPVFEVPYLIGVVTLGVLILRLAKGRRQFKLFGIMAIILGCGDAFHLVPRMYALWTDGIANHSASLGFGKLVTSITMTVFYVFLYHVWQERYKREDSKNIKFTLYALAALRIILCLFPQNSWFSADSPLSWGIYRNLPFVVLGGIIIYLYFIEARKNKDKAFRFMWLAITLSFAFYIPVVLWADKIPMLGMLMIPKTCAYVWIVWMGYADAKKSHKI
ncbi:MAG: hypothetical protein LBS21_03565 [Clostridiales bacterium]|jgi:hypothetical protein|nr:hypothetical protein [Clostridiales bacterium]